MYGMESANVRRIHKTELEGLESCDKTMLARYTPTVENTSWLSWLASSANNLARAGRLRRTLCIHREIITTLSIPKEAKEILEQAWEAKVVDLGMQVRDIECEHWRTRDKDWGQGLPVRKDFAELYEKIKDPPTPLRYVGVTESAKDEIQPSTI